MSGLARREGLAVMQPNFFVCLKRGFTPPPLLIMFFFYNFVQTFRNYREVFEDQKAAIEQRYRTLLEEAIQDAVFLSTRNQELMHENQVLKQGSETTTL